MNPEDFNYFQSRVSRFISGSNSRSKFSFFGAPKITRLSGFIPKRPIPQQIVDRFRPSQSADDSIDAPRREIASLGRVTLDLEIINNNLDRIRQVIEQDYKNTQQINKKEVEDYRKRIANRGRIFGRRELGDKKSDVLGAIKKYVGSFFSGTGGAIRALAMFNLLQGILSGDPSKIIGPLIGIGMTYLPAIGAGIAGSVVTSLVGRLFGGGRTAATASSAAGGAGAGASRFGGMRGFAGRAALIGGGLALANSLFNTEQDQPQQRLEQLTEQQKGSVDPQNLVPIPQDDLKRFENLNRKFEAALDFLLGKKPSDGEGSPGNGGGGGGPGGPMSDPYDIPGLNVDPGSVSTIEQFRSTLKGTPMESEADAIYNTALSEGLNPAFVAGLAGAESSFGSAGIAVGTKNPFGILHQGFSPKSYAEATQYLARHLRNPQGPYAGKRTLQDVMNTYSPPSENNTSRHIQNIMRIGSRTGGDPASLFLNLGAGGRSSSGQTLPPASPILPSAAQLNAAVRSSSRNIPVPSSQGPNVTLVPMSMGGDSPQQSAASGGNSTVPNINTTYSDNFLAMYSRLIYQVV